MRAATFTEYFTILLFFIGGFVGSEGVWFGWIISAGAIYWYFKHGQYFKGWVGSDLETMKRFGLPIHDALVVNDYVGPKVKEIMISTFKEHTGIDIPVTTDDD